MEVPFILLFTLSMVCLLRSVYAENGYKDIDKGHDMDIDGSSPSRSNILVHNTFHLPPLDQSFHIPQMDEMRSSEVIEDTQFTDPSIVRTPITDRYSFHSDGMRMLEGKINWLVKSNHQILSVLNALEYKINQTDDVESTNKFDIRSTKPLSGTIDLMDNLEVMNLLNNIHQFILASNSKPKRSEVLEADQIEVIREFVSAIESEKRNTGHMTTPSTPSSVNQVLANSWKTIQYLEKVSGTVQDIDERTVRMFDKSCRQGQKLSYENRYDDCICENGMIGKKVPENGRYERTYGNTKRDTNRVTFEPNKYNCHDLLTRKNGIYKFTSLDEVSNEAGRFLYERYCDFDTDGGAWTVIQRRFMNDQQENFNRSWLDYKLGFGELDKEFWFGNDFIHKLTFDEDVELRVVLEDARGRSGWAEYSLFRVDSEEYNYNLIIGGYRGTIRDGLLYHNDQEFSTYDRQNDDNDHLSCAASYGNGWWFNNCTQVNADYQGITWENWLGSHFLKSSKMMIRPKGLWGDRDSGEDGYIYTSNGMDP